MTDTQFEQVHQELYNAAHTDGGVRHVAEARLRQLEHRALLLAPIEAAAVEMVESAEAIIDLR
jgi:hypothetical protein